MATSLELLSLRFQDRRHRPRLETRRSLLPSLTRSILPALRKTHFVGASEYLEEILAWIEAPRLDELIVSLIDQYTFDTPQLFQFIRPTPTIRNKGRKSNFILGSLVSNSDHGHLIMMWWESHAP